MGLGALPVVLQLGIGALRLPDGGGDRREFGSISAGTHHLDASPPVLEAGDHVDMQVVDVLARWTTVIPAHVHAQRLECALDPCLDGLDGLEEVAHRRVIKVEERGRVDAGHDEYVATGCREYIQERNRPGALVNDLGRNATGDDLAEYAVGHPGSLAQVPRP
jgi:hypothetical protein